VTGFDYAILALSGTAKESHENPVRIAPVPEYKYVALLLELTFCV
jgi:hypothetical protein